MRSAGPTASSGVVRCLQTLATARIDLAHRDAEAAERILVIDDRVPHHDRGSGDPRMARMLAELVGLWPEARITLLASIPTNAERYAPPLLEQGIEVACADRALRPLVRSAPLSLLGGARQPCVEHRALREAPAAHAAPGPPDLRHRSARVPPARARRRREGAEAARARARRHRRGRRRLLRLRARGGFRPRADGRARPRALDVRRRAGSVAELRRARRSRLLRRLHGRAGRAK